MTKKLFLALIISVLITLSSAEEWYQQGHTNFLDWSSFDTAVSEPNSYKFVKFFTHNCRYCRMLKQLQEQLQAQQKWKFSFYEVDCSIHYDLCVAKVNPTAFPYVAIYNLKGQHEAKIAGYYPLDIMRDAFKDIQNRQVQALRKIGIDTPVQKIKLIQKEQKKEPEPLKPKEKINKIEHQQSTKVQTKQKISQKKIDTFSGEYEDWGSISDGIKILLIIAGFWMFKKQIHPLIKEQITTKSKIIEIPVYSSGQQSKPSRLPTNNQQTNRLLSGVL